MVLGSFRRKLEKGKETVQSFRAANVNPRKKRIREKNDCRSSSISKGGKPPVRAVSIVYEHQISGNPKRKNSNFSYQKKKEKREAASRRGGQKR